MLWLAAIFGAVAVGSLAVVETAAVSDDSNTEEDLETPIDIVETGDGSGADADPLPLPDQTDEGIRGDDGDDVLRGTGGDDTITGGAGDDFLSATRDGVPDHTRLDPGTDYLNGDQGEDIILASGGDILTGGSDTDTFIIGDWIGDATVEITDFDAEEDDLVVVWDDAEAPEEEPTLSLLPDTEAPTSTYLALNGEIIAHVAAPENAIADRLVLIPQSSLAATGLLPG